MYIVELQDLSKSGVFEQSDSDATSFSPKYGDVNLAAPEMGAFISSSTSPIGAPNILRGNRGKFITDSDVWLHGTGTQTVTIDLGAQRNVQSICLFLAQCDTVASGQSFLSPVEPVNSLSAIGGYQLPVGSFEISTDNSFYTVFPGSTFPADYTKVVFSCHTSITCRYIRYKTTAPAITGLIAPIAKIEAWGNYPTWVSNISYPKGYRVEYKRELFECLQLCPAGVTPTIPLNAVYWIKIGLPNRLQFFQYTSGSFYKSSSGFRTIDFISRFKADTICLFNYYGNESRVEISERISVKNATTNAVVSSSTNLPYSQSKLNTPSNSTIKSEKTVIYTDVPIEPLTTNISGSNRTETNRRIQISLSADTGTGQLNNDTIIPKIELSLGFLAIGKKLDIGLTAYSAISSNRDFSLKETNIYGDTTIVKRGFKRLIEVKTEIKNSDLREIQKKLDSLRSTVCAWIGTDDDRLIESLSTVGFYNNFSIDIAYPNHSLCTLSIESLI